MASPGESSIRRRMDAKVSQTASTSPKSRFMRRITMSGRFSTALFAIACLCAPLAAGERWGDVSGEDMRKALSDSTLTGTHDDGMPYSEWHAADGRVFGHNNRRPVDRGCWDIRGDQVCYYYRDFDDRPPRVACWEFRKVGAAGYRLKLMNRPSRMEATGLLQVGNPHGHSDNGRPWTCEPLQSRKGAPDAGAILAAR
jgi:hypothetical protein